MKGFAMVPTHVLRNRELPASARLLYGVVLTYAWGENPCTATNETLCGDCGIGRTALYDAIRVLTAAELIDVRKVKGQREIRPKVTGGVRIPDAEWPQGVSDTEYGIRTQDTEVDEVEIENPSTSELSFGPDEALVPREMVGDDATIDGVPPGSTIDELSNAAAPSPGTEAAPFLTAALADMMRRNDPKAKVAPESQGWLDAMRLLIDRDGRPFEEVADVLAWCQADEFWRTVILSAPKFREKYPQLRAVREARANTPNGRAAAAAAPTSTREQLAAIANRGSMDAADPETALRRRAGGR